MATRHWRNLSGARTAFDSGSGQEYIYRLDRLERTGVADDVARLPFSIRILLEAALRACDNFGVTQDDVVRLARWNVRDPAPVEIPFKPARVVMQDFAGAACVLDLAAMRAAIRRLGGDPRRINPLIPADLVVDHSVQVDEFGSPSALARNVEIEFERNRERYQFLRWGQQAFRNFRVVPPGAGIVHQVNLEYLAGVVLTQREPGADLPTALPDSVLGTDSHKTMINGLGVLGWGVGGIEAEAVMLGEPCYFLMPQVIGVRLTGALREDVTATDVALRITQLLRRKGVVDKFVEFYGPGLSNVSLPDRATIANMAPEYGATCAFFPVDDETLNYLRCSGRREEDVVRVERYCKEQGLFRTDQTPTPEFSDILEFDLGSIEPSLAGPRRPQDRVPLREMKRAFQIALHVVYGKNGDQKSAVSSQRSAVADGVVVIAAITSCTNTSNPAAMLAAGLLAKKAVERWMRTLSHVKTSLAPGSQVVTEYLRAAGLLPYLEQLGFYVVGYGCTTCVGNSGPLVDEVEQAVRDNNIIAVAVLSGNRNFEGRIHPLVKANYLASPPLVVAYALAGNVQIDLTTEPLGSDAQGKPVHLRDLLPSRAEIARTMQHIQLEMFRKTYAQIFETNAQWNALAGGQGDLYAWDAASTYIQEPPFLVDLKLEPEPLKPIEGSRVLALFGDSVTTDHISPVGSIASGSPAGRYLIECGVAPKDFNQYGARRGNHHVMMRGTFANVRLKNLLLGGEEGGYTLYLGPPTADPSTVLRASHQPPAKMAIFDVAMKYRQESVPLIVIAGKEYGTGSARDWAAKGTMLLGVRAVIAQSFERIHRANLVGMGVLPLQFKAGESVESLGLTGREAYDIVGIGDSIQPRQELVVNARREDDTVISFNVIARLDTPVDVLYYKNGGILPAAWRNLAK